MILIVTSKDDITSDYLISRMGERGIDCFRFHPEDMIHQFDVSIRLGGGLPCAEITDKILSKRLNLAGVNSAYFRKPKMPSVEKLPHPSNFALSELSEAVKSLWSFVRASAWLNTPQALRVANNKISQLLAADEIGFNVPETLVDTRTAKLLSFSRERNNDAVVKALKVGSFDKQGSEVVFTSRLLAEDLQIAEEFDGLIPMIAQQRIEKAADVRVTVIGQKVFAVAIYPVTDKYVDWREEYQERDLNHEIEILPEVINDRCVLLTRKFGLNFSCIDLIRDQKGEYHFLEMNPNGNWGWLEMRVGLPLRDAIIDFLIGGENGESKTN